MRRRRAPTFRCAWTLWGRPFIITNCSQEPLAATDVVIRVGEQDCYQLEYDRRPPNPSTIFTLHIPELRRDGVPIDLPTLRFVEGSSGWH